MLTTNQKCVPKASKKQENLDQSDENLNEVFSQTVMEDEIQVHHYVPQIKQESMQWRQLRSSASMKFHVQQTARKIIAIFLGL